MLSAIRKFFGSGYIYCQFECDDGTVGKSRAPYEGDPDTFNRDEYVRQLAHEVWFKHNKTISKITKMEIV